MTNFTLGLAFRVLPTAQQKEWLPSSYSNSVSDSFGSAPPTKQIQTLFFCVTVFLAVKARIVSTVSAAIAANATIVASYRVFTKNNALLLLS